MIKRGIIIVLLACFLISAVAAQTIKIEFPNGDEFDSGSKISLKVSLFDSSTNPVNKKIPIIFEDAVKNQLTKEITTNKIESIDLGENAAKGFWKIIAKDDGTEDIAIFSIKEKEDIDFELNGDVLTITNRGNAIYSKTIQIVIGETIGSKEVNLGVGESTSFRLIAPDGVYNIKISDGITTLTRGGISLTGEVTGILDESASKRTLITGINPDNPEGSYNFIKENKFVYIFIIIIISATILLTIEKRYRKA